MKESFEERVKRAEGRKKIFENRVKYILFFATLLTAFIAFWDKCTFHSHLSQPAIKNQLAADSLSKLKHNQLKKDSVSALPKKHHPGIKDQVPHVLSTHSGISQTEKKEEQPAATNLPQSTNPIQTANSDNIEFKLMKAVGNTGAQSVTITMVLTTSAANWYIMSYVRSIIDNDGNEYRIKSFTIGASDYNERINLVTGVPIKCTYTFGGILSGVKSIKLFKYDYTHSAGQPYYVEFRDIPVNWK